MAKRTMRSSKSSKKNNPEIRANRPGWRKKRDKKGHERRKRKNVKFVANNGGII